MSVETDLAQMQGIVKNFIRFSKKGPEVERRLQEVRETLGFQIDGSPQGHIQILTFDGGGIRPATDVEMKMYFLILNVIVLQLSIDGSPPEKKEIDESS